GKHAYQHPLASIWLKVDPSSGRVHRYQESKNNNRGVMWMKADPGNITYGAQIHMIYLYCQDRYSSCCNNHHAINF
ncbi:MAG: hypothetical protein WA461_09555, partial [Nitrososphaeraceae archaeon]